MVEPDPSDSRTLRIEITQRSVVLALRAVHVEAVANTYCEATGCEAAIESLRRNTHRAFGWMLRALCCTSARNARSTGDAASLRQAMSNWVIGRSCSGR